MTRAARPTDAMATIALTANQTPAAGLGTAPRALLSDPVATMAMTRRNQKERRALP